MMHGFRNDCPALIGNWIARRSFAAAPLRGALNWTLHHPV